MRSLSVSVLLFAASFADAKEPTARDSLKKAFRNLTSLKSFHVEASFRAGLVVPESSTAAIREEAANRSYEGAVAAPTGRRLTVMFVEDMGVYRTASGVAVVEYQGRWARMSNAMASQRKLYEALQMNRLFEFPEVALQTAMKYWKASRWLSDEESRALYGDGEAKSTLAEKARKATTQPPRGETSKTAVSSDAQVRVVRVTLPTRAAMQAVEKQAIRFKQCCSGAVKLSGVRAPPTEVYFDIHIDSKSQLPVRFDSVYMTGHFDGKKGATLWKGREKIEGQSTDRVVLKTSYSLGAFGEATVEPPAAAQKLLRN